MTHEPEDPRLTAYALGELDANQRAEVEALLARDPDARREVDALRVLGQDLATAFAPDTAIAGLAPAQRTRIGRRARGPGRRVVLRRLALAAGVLLVVGPLALFLAVGRGGGGGSGFRSPGPDDLQAYLPEGEEDGEERGPTRRDEVIARSSRLSGEPSNVAFEDETDGDGRSEHRETPRMAGREARGRAPASPAGAPGEPPADLQPAPPASDPAPGGAKLPPGLREPVDPTLPAPPVFHSTNPLAGVPPTPGVPSLAGSPTTPMAPALVPTTGPESESYLHPGMDGFHRVTKRDEHTSTFSVDVDTASYSNLRRMLRNGQRPPASAVRIEELINAFDYAYAPPAEGAAAPFATHVQIAACPWNPSHRLARIALKGREITREGRPAANLVFLVDVSGSMDSEDKLPLVRTSLEMLVEQLRDDDRVAIVTYASSARLALPSTPGSEREGILEAIRNLRAGGSTNGAGGIQLAYEQAKEGFRKGGVNRVLLCTDGDFNVGISDTNELVRLITDKARTGVFLSVLGYGTGNYKDDKMEALSNKGNGTYAYIDGQDEARRVLVEQMDGTLVTIAKDVKFQLWFNPRTVAAWRLLGYENRRLAAADFNDDTKDAGDVGAGHEVTALYEIVPAGAGVPGQVDPNPFVTPKGAGGEEVLHSEDPTPDAKALFIWRLRWKAPDGERSSLLERNVFDDGLGFEQVDRDFQWAAAVTAFGMLLRHSPHAAQATWPLVEELARPAIGEDPKGRRAEFLELVKIAGALEGK